jgi:two-component system nitrogen regulation response regulator NtrX
VDVRTIAATNKRLDEEMERGTFRADLFYRINVIPFEIPPLRERAEDIPLLIDYFNGKYSTGYRRDPKVFAQEAIDVLTSYDWPGNVRELRNTVERVVIMTSKETVSAGELPALGVENSRPSNRGRYSSYRAGRETFEREYILRKLAECEGNMTRTAEAMGIDRSHLYRRMKALGINSNRM